MIETRNSAIVIFFFFEQVTMLTFARCFYIIMENGTDYLSIYFTFLEQIKV